jgi:glutathione peroxidase
MIATLAFTMLLFKKQAAPVPQQIQEIPNWYAFKMPDIDGKVQPMSEYKGKVVLVVNVASKCGLTPQYEALEALYEKYKEKGFVIAGFPCNDFNGQEPGDEAQIKQFCTANYNVKFPLYSKLHVKGPEQHDMYKWLVWKTGGKDIEWNFGKILIGKDGSVLTRFDPRTKPDDPKVVEAVEKALAG